jgi:hypothetical protein
MKRLYTYLILTIALLPATGQTVYHKVPGGVIYQTTIYNKSYQFDHAKYTIFIPDGIEKISGVFIHQHGCTMQGHGEATAYDLQYQAFARKWSLALVGPDLYPHTKKECEEWRNSEDGSLSSLLAGLFNIAQYSNHPELSTAPWLLWGHSGGGYWVLSMIKSSPKRIIAAVCYSPAFDPNFDYPQEAAKIPILIRHAGATDDNYPGDDCWKTALHSFSQLRKMDGLVSLAYNAGQNHNFTYLRYITIPFFESVLAQRIHLTKSGELNEMDQTKSWLCDTTATGIVHVYKASTFTGNPRGMSWLPDSACAVKFKEYISTGIVKDITPPVAPIKLKLTSKGDSAVELSWEAKADIESGIGHFNIYRNGLLIARYPSEGDFQSFDTNGDDAVPINPSPMVFRIPIIDIRKTNPIAITTVNRFNLESPKAKISWR